jgi:epoxyqueuosine reductase
MPYTSLRECVEGEAQHLGFTRIRVAAVRSPPPGLAEFDRFLAEGRAGDMAWLARGRSPRADPAELLPGARSAVALGIEYGWPRPPDPGGLTGKVACYAWGRDYHNAIGKRLKKLCAALSAQLPDARFYAGVDARPILERAWAQDAGLGFLGKNGCIIAPAETSYLFLAIVLTTLELAPDAPQGDHCGRCRRCLDGCPTAAFTAPRQIDALRCISYHTIENRSAIPEDLRGAFGRWVFGCDDCQEVCPHNGKPSSLDPDFAPRPGHAWVDLEWVLRTPDEVLRSHFAGSPIRRTGPVGLKRNACVVLGNLGEPAARPVLEHALRHDSSLVQEHARWALDRL